MIRKKVRDVAQGQRFNYAGRSYVLATEEEQGKHPNTGLTLAYYTPTRGARVPVTFGPLTEVFVEK